MAAPRSLPGPADLHSGGTEPGIGPGRATERANRIARLAARWAALAPESAGAAVAARLATMLRRLAAVVGAEPFSPIAARGFGAQLLATGLCGDPAGPGAAAEDALAASLRLLRREAPSALGATGPDGERRLGDALDEMAAGFARALTDRGGLDRPHRRPPQALDGAGRAPDAGGRHYRAVYEQAALGIAIGSLDGHVLDLNPALCRMLGLAGPLEQPRPVSDFVHPDDLAEVVERHHRLVRGAPASMRMQLRLVRPDSKVVLTRIVASLVRHDDGAPSQVMAVVEGVSARRRPRLQLPPASARDQLTSLPGPAFAEQWLRDAFAEGGAKRAGVCAIDLDGFHALNDAYGEDVGDRLLRDVVGRLRLAAGEHLVTRTGVAGFAVLVADPAGGTDVCRLADRLQEALVSPFLLAGHPVGVTASIGVAEGSTAHGCAAELLRAADVARSRATALGGGRRVVYDHERDAGEAMRFALLSRLRGGVGRGEFRLVYQPLVDLAGGRVQGAEALVRWQHPELGLIGPGCFISLAEDSGAIVALGRWVLEAACTQAATWWRELGADAPYVSVNVSPIQLAEAGWVREVTEVLAATGLPPDRLQLEITEQAVLGDETAARDALTALRDEGVRLALDDFGTGYSSLSWLRRLPVHALKIDGSFIDGLRTPSADPVTASIVRAMVEMAHALRLEVTAEWVETAVQAERLKALGCDVGQGHWFGDAGPGEWVPGLWRRSVED